MNPRGEFLQAFFRIIELREVPYCILRNYDDVFANTDSDVDLAVEPQQMQPLNECLAEAAATSGHRLVPRSN